MSEPAQREAQQQHMPGAAADAVAPTDDEPDWASAMYSLQPASGVEHDYIPLEQ